MHPLDLLALTAMPTYTEAMEVPLGESPDYLDFNCMTMILAAEWEAERYGNIPVFSIACATWAGGYHATEVIDYLSQGFRL